MLSDEALAESDSPLRGEYGIMGLWGYGALGVMELRSLGEFLFPGYTEYRY